MEVGQQQQQPPSHSDRDTDDEPSPMDISVEPVLGGGRSPEPSPSSSATTYRSSVKLQINSPPLPPPPPPQQQLPRMQAFATGPPSSSTGAIPKARPPAAKLQETRQRQLDSLRKMEDRLKNLAAEQNKAKKQRAARACSPPPAVSISRCPCNRLSMFVIDISEAVSGHVVTWLPVKSNASLSAPEETILYSLAKGRGEIIMFGGIQKDVNTMSVGRQQQQPAGGVGGVAVGAPVAATNNDTASNSLYFLCPPSSVV